MSAKPPAGGRSSPSGGGDRGGAPVRGGAGARSAPARQSSLRRLSELGIRPNHELGQSFLVDDNLLAVIERAAELDPATDVVLEIGGGLGTLSEHLAPRVRHLHVVEVDERLEPALREALDPYPNATLHLVDALELDIGSLDPAPTKLVANLPYGVAATVLLDTVLRRPEMKLWVAMVQREVAERLAAAPGTRTYGATSVLAQLGCDVSVLRRVSPGVFHPRPHVESALVRLRRTRPPPDAMTTDLVRAAFAHRRKTLAGSLALAPGAEGEVRERARTALEELGHPPDVRAERLTTHDFEALTRALGPEGRHRALGAEAVDRPDPSSPERSGRNG